MRPIELLPIHGSENAPFGEIVVLQIERLAFQPRCSEISGLGGNPDCASLHTRRNRNLPAAANQAKHDPTETDRIMHRSDHALDRSPVLSRQAGEPVIRPPDG